MAGRQGEVQELLLDFAFPMTKCAAGLVDSLFIEYQYYANQSLPGREELQCWFDFLKENLHILRRGNEFWPTHKILLQLAVEYADENPVTRAAEAWLALGSCNWKWLRCTRRPKNIPINSCKLVLEGHTSNIDQVFELSTGDLISWSDDGTCRFWDPSTGANVKTLSHYGTAAGGYFGVEFPSPGVIELPDHCVLLWANKKYLQIVNLDDFRQERIFEHDDTVRGALLLPHKRLLSWSEDRTARIWNIETGELQRCLQHLGWVFGAMLLSTGNILTWSGEHNLHIWDPDSGNRLAELQGHEQDIKGVVELPNGILLTWARFDSYRLWTIDGQAIPHTELPDLAMPWGFGPNLVRADGNPMSTTTVRGSLVATQTGDLLQIRNFRQPFSLPPIHADEALLRSDGTVVMWDSEHLYRLNVNSGNLLRIPIPTQMKDEEKIFAHINGVIEFRNPDGLCFWTDKDLWLWIGQTLEKLSGHKERINGVSQLSARHDGHLLSWSDDTTLRVWDINTGLTLQVLSGHNGKIIGARELSSGRIVSYSGLWAGTDLLGGYLADDTTIRIWEIPPCPLADYGKLSGIKEPVGFIRLEDTTVFAWGTEEGDPDDNETVWIMDARSGIILQTIKNGVGKLKRVVPLGSSRVATIGDDNLLRIWSTAYESKPSRQADLPYGDLKFLQSEHYDVPESASIFLSYSGDRIISYGDDGTLRLWELGRGLVETVRIGGKLGQAHSLPDERVLFWVHGSNVIGIWILDTGQIIELEGHTKQIIGFKALRNGCILTWSQDSTLRIWDITTGKSIYLKEGVDIYNDGLAGFGQDDGSNRVLELSDGRIFCPRTNLAWGGICDVCGIWDYRQNKFTLLDNYSRASKALELSDGRLLLLPEHERTLEIVDANFSGGALKLEGHEQRVIGAVETDQGHVATWDKAGLLFLWRTDTGKLLEKNQVGPGVNLDRDFTIKRAFNNGQTLKVNMEKFIAMVRVEINHTTPVVWHSGYEIWKSKAYETFGTIVLRSYGQLKVLKLYDGNQPLERFT